MSANIGLVCMADQVVTIFRVVDKRSINVKLNLVFLPMVRKFGAIGQVEIAECIITS